MAKPIRALVDGDEIAYKAFSGSSLTIDWDEDGETVSQSIKRSIEAAENKLAGWLAKVKADKVVICLSCADRNTFRHQLVDDYKGGRTDKPAEYWAVVEHLSLNYETVEFPFLEADDVMGIMSADPEYDNVIMSSDKDMKTIAGRLYDPYHDKKHRITKLAADRWWMTQTLTGDFTDGFKGCPKIGPKKAEAILAGCPNLQSMWSAVVETYAKKGLSESYALTQARLARILRPGDYNFNTGKVTLWKP